MDRLRAVRAEVAAQLARAEREAAGAAPEPLCELTAVPPPSEPTEETCPP